MRYYRNNRQPYSRNRRMSRSISERFYSRRRLNESQMWAEGEDSIPGGGTWELYNLDVWGNEEDGYEINDVFPTGNIYCISPSANDRDIENLVRSLYRISREEHLRVDWDEYRIYVDISGTGEPICEFRADY